MTMDPSIAAIILSAGKSERMGRPKALLEFGGKTFLQTILDAVAASRVKHTVVVLGHHREAISEAIRLDHAVFNKDYELGMITSLQTGIRTLPDCDGAMLFLVDHPVVEPGTIDALIRSFKPGHIVLPTHDGRRGHPVLFSRAVLDEILDLPSNAGANQVVRKDPQRIVEVPVKSSGVTIDIDTPEQYESFLEQSS